MFALCPSVTFRRRVGAHELEAEPHDAPGAGHRDRLDREPRVLTQLPPREPEELGAQLERLRRSLPELDALVQVLGVLADHDQVDVGVARGQPGERSGRSDRGEEVERLTELDVHAPEPRADRRGDRTLDRDARASDLLEDAFGEGGSLTLQDLGAGVLDDPLDLDTGRVEHATGRVRDLGPDAVAGDERHEVRHARTLSGVGRSQNRSNRIERFTSWIALVTSMPRGQASVQLNVVRQRNTPVFSERIFRRSFPPSSRES